MQDELVQPLRSPVDLPRIESVDETDLMNAPFPAEIRELCDLRLPGRLLNFFSFLTAKRHLFFSSSDRSPRVRGVGVPQGGVLSPILFNLHQRLLNRFLPAGVRAAMYADDLLLYVRGTDSAWALNLLELAMGSLTPWLGFRFPSASCVSYQGHGVRGLPPGGCVSCRLGAACSFLT